MKKLMCFLLILFPLCTFSSEPSTSCSNWNSWLKPICQRLHQIWTEGNNELYLSGYAWHNRYTYSPENVRKFNEAAWGGGLGKGFIDEKGNFHGLAAIAFLDSHRHLEPVMGYLFVKNAQLSPDFRVGIGYTLLLTSRPDINNGIPFPGILPWATVLYKKVTLNATYIPGAAGAGNVFYLLGKYTF